MAYMSQDRKKRIAAELKKVVPSDWKYTLSVQHHSQLTMTIRKGPEALMIEPESWRYGEFTEQHMVEGGYRDLNVYHLKSYVVPELYDTMKAILDTLNLENYDNSDVMSDYFDVGYYVELNIGSYDKPFEAI